MVLRHEAPSRFDRGQRVIFVPVNGAARCRQKWHFALRTFQRPCIIETAATVSFHACCHAVLAAIHRRMAARL
ncbi:MAG: hypothetical protein JWN70_3942 [Planctomycetaceae bacterium]|nr:hypothetical protein [Planctomycetaceae bacterium]